MQNTDNELATIPPQQLFQNAVQHMVDKAMKSNAEMSCPLKKNENLRYCMKNATVITEKSFQIFVNFFDEFKQFK